MTHALYAAQQILTLIILITGFSGVVNNCKSQPVHEAAALTGIDKNLVLGKFSYRKHPDFVKVNSKYASKTVYLQTLVYVAFIRMFSEAQKQGITLQILSGTRSFYQQKAIWERKWQKYASMNPQERTKKILRFSAMPATSRHHWGTDVDLNSLTNSYFEKGEGKKVYDWLVLHGPTYGFYQVYTAKAGGRTGYSEEKWHWSYLPLANSYLQYYNQHITYSDIAGFEGANWAQKLDVIELYVNGVGGLDK